MYKGNSLICGTTKQTHGGARCSESPWVLCETWTFGNPSPWIPPGFSLQLKSTFSKRTYGVVATVSHQRSSREELDCLGRRDFQFLSSQLSGPSKTIIVCELTKKYLGNKVQSIDLCCTSWLIAWNWFLFIQPTMPIWHKTASSPHLCHLHQ